MPATVSDPERWVDDYGDYLYACAMLRLRHPTKAKDVVQETFLAALKSRQSYAGKSSEKAWLTGILKHKIYRSLSRNFAGNLLHRSDI